MLFAAGMAGLSLAAVPILPVNFGLSLPLTVAVSASSVVLLCASAFLWVRSIERRHAEVQMLHDHGADLVMHHDGAGRVMSVSPRCVALLGHDGAHYKGRTLHGYIHPGDWQGLERLMADVKDAEADLDLPRLDLRLRHHDGGYRWVEMRVAPLPSASGQNDAGFVASYRCIEARKRREETLERARESAEAASAAKTRFLANVSHELRTPLNAIIGFSEVMCVEMFGPLGARRYQEYADYIHESGRHLLDLINDILDMSKIEAGRYDLQMETVRMPLVIERCLKTIAFAARKGRLQLAVDIPADIPDVQADSRAMRQILLNLLSNAIKFTGPGGRVMIALQSDAEWLELVVEDTGLGIPEEAVGRLGRPFEQFHQTVAFDGSPAEEGGGPRAGLPGTGLGLSIVKALVTLHGGTLIIDSEEGVGTAVRVLLPLSPMPIDPGKDDDDDEDAEDRETAQQAA